MPTPILKIPIDDAAAQRYFAAFRKYQEELAKQPEMWKGVNDALGGIAVAGAAIAAEIAHQSEETRRLAAEEEKRVAAEKKAAKDKADADKAEADRDKEAAARRKHAIDQVKEYSRSLADAAVNLGKWAIIGEGASLAAGALTFWGLDRFVAGVGEERRLAQGLGVSIGQRQGMGLNMQRYFDVNSLLETAANAQATPASWGMFRMMGVDPTGKDPAQLAGEMALAARRMFIADRGNLALAQAQGLTQAFSPDDLRRLAATPEADLKGSIADSKRFAAQGLLSDEVAQKWQRFIINLDTAGLKIKNTLIDKLTVLENNGDLDKIIKKFGDLAVDVLDRIDFDKLGQGLDKFTAYVTSQKFQRDFETFITDVGLVAQKLADALVWLGVIPDPHAKPPPPPTGPGGGNMYRTPTSTPAGVGGALNYLTGKALSTAGKGLSWIEKELVAASTSFHLPDNLLSNIFGAESSRGRNAGFSKAGALGPFQFMGPTAVQYGVTDRTDFDQSVVGAAHYLSDLLKEFQGDTRKAAAAYNWGQGHVESDIKRHGAAWENFLPAETHRYIDRVAPSAHAALAAHAAPVVHVKITNQTGASVATTINSAAGG